jgi:hypothetical protein
MKFLRLEMLDMGPPPLWANRVCAHGFSAGKGRKAKPFLEETFVHRSYTRALMGHLADRYRDANRSGVYRVTDAAIPRAAALEAGPAAQVLIIEGLDKLASESPHEFAGVLAALASIAASRRERGAPFFAVLVDPGRLLSLPALYKERS